MKHKITALVASALDTLSIEHDQPIHVEQTRDKKFGDFACNIAMVLGKKLGTKPRDLAEKIIASIPASDDIIKVEIAGPGFMNFYINDNTLLETIKTILAQKQQYGRSQHGAGKRVHMEIVSANPTGPLHVGHGRLAAVGAVCADLLEAIGYSVHREYYVNDAGRQMNILALSVWLRYLMLHQQDIVFPSNAYQGDYIIAIAEQLRDSDGEKYLHTVNTVFADIPADEPQGGDKEKHIDALIARAKQLLGEASYRHIFQQALDAVLGDIRDDLAEFGVHYQNWYSEQGLHDSGAIEASLKTLRDGNYLYEKEGATWLRTTDFGDDDDRVVIRNNGQPTYFAPDIAYHHEKFTRGFDWVIDELGSDHHGYVPRLRAALKAQGDDPDKLSVMFIQFVNLYRGDEKISMSTRKGSFVTLRELREEVGNDAARFFYIMRKSEQHLDFDLELAKSRSNENPVYYIQYAHARIHSVFQQLADKDLHWDETLGLASLSRLQETQETQLIEHLAKYGDTLKRAALQQEPHLLTHYLRDLANYFHSYYNAHQFLVDDTALRNARLCLVKACRTVLRNGLQTLNISTPDTM